MVLYILFNIIHYQNKNIYDTDIEYIYDYIELNKIINDKNKILYIINHILNNNHNEYKIIDDTYIIKN